MKRRVLTGLSAASAVAAMAPAAHAGPRADYQQFFSTPAPGASAGIETKILYKNPADPNAKPVPVREEVFTFPEGTQFDDSVVPVCPASDVELELTNGGACPKESWVGQGLGDTTMTGFPGAGETPIQVDGWNDGSGTVLLGGDERLHLRFATRADRVDRTITVEVPRTPGGPPDGESALRRIDNVFGARSLGDRAYLRTPGSCPSAGVWTFTAQFTFADGVVEHDSYSMACTRP